MTWKYTKSNFISIELKFDLYLLDFSVSPNQYVTMCLHDPMFHEILYEKTGEKQKLMNKSD